MYVTRVLRSLRHGPSEHEHRRFGRLEERKSIDSGGSVDRRAGEIKRNAADGVGGPFEGPFRRLGVPSNLTRTTETEIDGGWNGVRWSGMVK